MYQLISRLKRLFLTSTTVGSQNRYLPRSLLQPSLRKSKWLLSSQTSNHYMANGMWISQTICVKKRTLIVDGFKSTDVTEAIQSAEEIVTIVENPFHEENARVSGMLYRFIFC